MKIINIPVTNHSFQMIRPNGELLFSEDRISVWKEESILEMAVVMVSQQCEYVQGH